MIKRTPAGAPKVKEANALETRDGVMCPMQLYGTGNALVASAGSHSKVVAWPLDALLGQRVHD